MSDNNSNNKRIAKNTIILYFRLIITMVVGLYTSRAFLDALGVENYGIYNIVGGFVALFAILTNNIRSAAQRFITYALGKGNFEELKNTFSTFFTLYIIVSVLIIFIGECVGLFAFDKILVIPEGRLDAAFFVFHCSLCVFAANLMAIPFNASIIAHEKMNFFALTSIVDAILKLIIVYCVYYTPFDSLKTYALLLCFVSVLMFFVYAIYCWYHFPETKAECQISRPLFRNIFSYSMWVTIGASSAIVKEQGVNLVINHFCGVVMNAAKGVSMQVEHILHQFARDIGTAITPQITKSYAAGDSQRAIDLTFLLAKAQGLLLLFLCLPVIAEADYILSLWLKEVPDHAVLFTRWVLILCIARTLEGSTVPLHLAIGKQKYIQLVCGGLMLCNLPLSYLVLKVGFDPVSTIVVGVIIEFVVLFIVTLFLKKYIKFPVLSFLMRSILSVIVVGAITMTTLWLITSLIPSNFYRLLISGITSTLLVSILSYSICLDSKERGFVANIIKQRILKFKK